MALTAPYLPNSEMAMLAWIKANPAAPPAATTLPGDPASWTATGFVVVRAVGGTGGMYTPERHPVLSLDVWTVNPSPGSQQAPWGKAQALAEQLHRAFFDPARFPIEASWPSYVDAVISSGWPLIEPRKVPGSEAGYAHVSFDAQLDWRPAT